MKIFFILHCLCTMLMTGVIWVIQLVHYPLFLKVGESAFQTYHTLHTQYISYLVMPLMLTELLTAIYFVYQPPIFLLFSWYWYTGLFLLLVIWGATFFVQVPQHQLLNNGFDPDTCIRLVKGNWIRTVAWTIRTMLIGYFIYYSMD